MMPRLEIRYRFSDFYQSLKGLFSTTAVVPIGDVFYCNHSRTALRVALSSLQLPANAKVGIMAFNCHTVMNAVIQAGYNIEFIDVTDDLRLDTNDLKLKGLNLSALVVTHLFGLQNDVMAIRSICPQIPIIEDCAHAYLSELNHHQAGSLGDLATFSIGVAKFPSIGDGGYLRVNNASYLPAIKLTYNDLKSPTWIGEVKQLIRGVVYGWMYTPLLYAWITLPLKQKKNASLEVTRKETETRMCRVNYSRFKHQIANVPAIKQRRLQRITELASTLHETYPTLFIPNLDGSNGFMLPTLSTQRDSVIIGFASKNMEVAPHFSNAIQWAQQFGYVLGTCKNAETIVHRIIVFPTYY